MTTTLAALETKCRKNLRDNVSASWVFTSAEIQDLIGEGIDALTSFYPNEIVTSISISTGTYSYAVPSTVKDIFRVEVIDADGVRQQTLRPSPTSPAAGWVKHGGTLYIPPSSSWTTGMTLQVWGYGPWTYIDSSSATSATTNLDQSALIAVAKYVSYGVYERLCSDRSKFQQMQQHPENTDVQPIALLQYRSAARQAWENQKRDLRFMRKTS